MIGTEEESAKKNQHVVNFQITEPKQLPFILHRVKTHNEFPFIHQRVKTHNESPFLHRRVKIRNLKETQIPK